MARSAWSRLARPSSAACFAAASLSTLPCMCESTDGKQPRPAIYMTMGPSGAGKDTLLLGARKQLQLEGNSSVEFVKRVITRSADKVTDLEIPVTLEEFKAASDRREYAIEYYANKTHYAIPRKSLDAGILSNKRLVLNVSRTVIEQVRAEYGDKMGIEVYCLNITASENELKRRLLGRGRETVADVEDRIARAKLLEPRGPHVINVVNEASQEAGIDLATHALTGRLKYSLWLVPPRESLFHVAASKEIENLAAEHGMQPFAPHITVGKSFVATQSEAIEIAKAAASSVGAPVTASLLDVSSSPSAFFRAAVVEVKPTVEICDACAVVRRTAKFDKDTSFHEIAEDVRRNYAPHVSFLYGKHGEHALEAAADHIRHAISSSACLSSGFVAEELVLVMTHGEAYRCWTEVARFPLRTSNLRCAL